MKRVPFSARNGIVNRNETTPAAGPRIPSFPLISRAHIFLPPYHRFPALRAHTLERIRVDVQIFTILPLSLLLHIFFLERSPLHCFRLVRHPFQFSRPFPSRFYLLVIHFFPTSSPSFPPVTKILGFIGVYFVAGT